MLASNESCFSPFPAVVEAAAAVLAGVHRYPDPAYAPLRRALSDRYGVPAERIALGNGSCDILLAAGEALLEPGAEVVYSWPAFSVYPHLAAASGARAIEVPLDADDRHDLDAMAAEITVATRLALICNPNNPTSTSVGLDAVEAFLERVPGHVCVILDEAYCEFSLALGDPYASVELLAPLSEPGAAADVLEGLRVGGAAGRLRAVRLARVPRRRRPGAPAVLFERRPRRLRPSRRCAGRTTSTAGSSDTLALRAGLVEGVEALGLWIAESDANFVWLRLPDGVDEGDVVAGLRDRGVLVRAGKSLGREGAMRVTVGTEHENERFVAALGGARRVARCPR